MKEAALLLAYGAPERLEDVPEYLRRMRKGRPVPDAVLEEVKRRYRAVGGSSPLREWTQRQATALEKRLATPVYFAMRNWHPFIRDVLATMKSDGFRRLVATCLTPQYSYMTIGLYAHEVQEARRAVGLEASIRWTSSFYAHPLLIEAFRQRLAPLLPAEMVLFTAHSFPERSLTGSDPYLGETHATARAIATSCALERWELAYQSQGMTHEPWIGPTVESRLDEYAERGITDVILAPIGFVADNLEILYDVDIHFRRYALSRGIRLRRPESLNDSPTFIAALAAVIEAHRERV